MTVADALCDLRPATAQPRDEPASRRLAALFSCALHVAVIAGLASHWPVAPAFGPDAEVVEVEIVDPIEPATPASPTSSAADATTEPQPPMAAARSTEVSSSDPPPPAPVEDRPETDVASAEPPPATQASTTIDAPAAAPMPEPVAPSEVEDGILPPPPRPTAAATPPASPTPKRARPEHRPPKRAPVDAADRERAEPAATKRKTETVAAMASSRAPNAGSPSRNRAGAGGRDPLAAYLATVKAQIVGRRRPHVGTERGRVEVRFVVSADGSIAGVRGASVAAPSLEDEAMRLVRRASPVAPIPVALGRTSLAMSVTVDFE